MPFSYPTVGNCLGRGTAPINGCSNKRWKDNDNERAIDRQELRRSFGNYLINDSDISCNGQLCAQLPNQDSVSQCGANGKGLLTPFRRAMNAGDPYGKVNSAPSNTITPPPSNQVNAPTRTSLAGWGVLAGSTKTVAGGSAYTGNPKYVYDSSDYIRFKKLQAKNRNYNDPTYGGDQHFAAQTVLARVRH
jgi:hypothetical protein